MPKVTEPRIVHWAAEPRLHPLGLASFCWARDDARKGGWASRETERGEGRYEEAWGP